MTARIVARSVHGLEWVAADEIAGRFPEAHPLALARREVTFELPTLHSGLLALRTVDDVFVRVGEVDDVGTAKDVPPLLAKRLAQLPWDAWLAALREVRPVPARPGFDVVASLEGRRNYNRFAVEHAVGSALAPLLRGSYLARTNEGRQRGESDLTVRVFLRGPVAIAALRLGVRPLHRRAYKQDTGAGTLHPPAAAALARLAAPAGAAVVLDPFCGDGTIGIETALASPRARVVASDLDPVRLAHARRNAGRAGVDLALVRADAGRPPFRRHALDVILTNPPWNLAVDAGGRLTGSLDRFWREVTGLLAADGRAGLITDADLDAPRTLRRLGYEMGLATQVRLAGRVAHLVLCTPPGAEPPAVPDGLAAWRRRAIAAGVVTDEGF